MPCMTPWLVVGVFHRDLTLGNIMGNVDCTFKVIDLGMSGPPMPSFVHEDEADRRFSHRYSMPSPLKLAVCRGNSLLKAISSGNKNASSGQPRHLIQCSKADEKNLPS